MLSAGGFQLADGFVKNFAYLFEVCRFWFGVESDRFAQNAQARAFEAVLIEKFCKRFRNMADAARRNRDLPDRSRP